MHYSTFHISILIDLMLVKAKEPRDYSGLKNLSEKIEDDQLSKKYKDTDRMNSKSKKQHEYIHENLNRKIETNKIKISDKITVNEEYLKEYLNYLEYETFDIFKENIDRIRNQLERFYEKKLRIEFWIATENKNKVAGLLEQGLYSGQKSNIKKIFYDGLVAEWLDKLVKSSKQNGVVLFIHPSLIKVSDNGFRNLLEDQKETLICYWLTDQRSDLNSFFQGKGIEQVLKGVEEADDFNILIQLLNYSQLTTNQEVLDKQKPTSNISIKDSNTVVLGNMNIKGKYISERDMYFNKMKKPKK